MEAKVMIELIQKSNKLEDVILNMSDFLTEYKGIAKVLNGKYKHANNFLWSKTKQEFLPV